METAKLKGTLAVAVTLVALSACSQNPQFRINTANQVYSALNDLQVLLAKAELGRFRQASSFNGAADSYAKVIGGFQVGRFVAVGLPPDADVAGADALNPQDGFIARCVDQVRRMAATHRTSGIAPDAAIIGTVRHDCAAAARAVAANESSALLLTTAAGYL